MALDNWAQLDAFVIYAQWVELYLTWKTSETQTIHSVQRWNNVDKKSDINQNVEWMKRFGGNEKSYSRVVAFFFRCCHNNV